MTKSTEDKGMILCTGVSMTTYYLVVKGMTCLKAMVETIFCMGMMETIYCSVEMEEIKCMGATGMTTW